MTVQTEITTPVSIKLNLTSNITLILAGVILITLSSLSRLPFGSSPEIDPPAIKITILIIGILALGIGALNTYLIVRNGGEQEEGRNTPAHSEITPLEIETDFGVTEFDTINAILDAFVQHDPLDFVSYYKQGVLEYSVCPDFETRLRVFQIDKTRREQVEHYCSLAENLNKTIDQLNNTFDQLDQGILIRTIFDVKKGGIFYYHFDDDQYLFGATVDQSKMNNDKSDHMMRELFEIVKKYAEMQ